MGRDNNKEKANGPERKLIRDLAELLDETGLSEIEIERAGLKIRVARHGHIPMHAMAPPLSPAHVPGSTDHGDHTTHSSPISQDQINHPGAVKSPMVGTVYLAPEPNAPPFVEAGSSVSEGQTVLIIEAMKTMNHIPAPRSGTLRQILVANSQPVEFGEPLFIIE
ncbi:MAG: acetyl-CoA carboxylase biotin carboxyl carrier protein [Hyphomicrobiaceae bacterium]